MVAPTFFSMRTSVIAGTPWVDGYAPRVVTSRRAARAAGAYTRREGGCRQLRTRRRRLHLWNCRAIAGAELRRAPGDRGLLAPDLLGDLDDHPQLVGLPLARQRVALDGGGEPTLRRQAELVEIDVLRGL